ncbi:MAG UNVERIFIED_CONTAM: hypothetical protein LVT10_22875 [Anaerolineae bacterium]|jgi:hypothetical protein
MPNTVVGQLQGYQTITNPIPVIYVMKNRQTKRIQNKAVTHYAITRNDFLNQLHGGQKIANRYLCIYQTDLSASEQSYPENPSPSPTHLETL